MSSLGVLKVTEASLALEQVKKVIPSLTHALHKGQSGKIGIVGGSREYTGAPYYAGMSALKVGADLAHIFCDDLAATPLKCYSPELIVHPGAGEGGSLGDSLGGWLPSLHSLVIGPGLGRAPGTERWAKEVIRKALLSSLPLLLDGDALWILSRSPDLLENSLKSPVVLTPNVAEFRRLCEVFHLQGFAADLPTLSLK